jgi:ribonuclease HII
MERINFDLNLIGNYDYILGIDEVGWGCVAGSLVLGGALVPKEVLLNNEFEWLSEIKDSKKLSDKKRKIILEKIKSQSKIEYAVGEATAEVINQIG